ncbi:MAG: hypothetical protein AUG04_01860 [Deltaproteobacteria bacterium 13_1_20CM_2_69_21]|nr:MAG: hypothetical protein AUH83_07500 [Deltaproteobacteria bacterium 13_1_40CM_4_68_19]OLE64137.1 MAG: hypothetical protein AUG04_01860 [Deltaproteobacteria bacterium 13_1_20CM_2_69_21]
MKKAIAYIACLLLCTSGAAHAERTHAAHSHGFLRGHSLSFGLDTEIGVPLGNYADASSVGGGAAVTGELTLLETLSATMRVGFEAHTARDIGATSSHVHALPILFGTKYYLGPERAGVFGAFEAGTFLLMSSFTPARGASTSSTDLRFGLGAGIGFQQDRWNVRVNVHTQDVGNFGNAFMMTGGIGYEFGGV